MADFGGGTFAQEGTSVGFKVGEHYAAEVCSAYFADIRDDLVHRLQKVFCAAELDASFQNVRSRLGRKVCHLVHISLVRELLRVGAVTFVGVVKV